MSLTGYSQATVFSWAKQNFRANFERLPGARDVAVQQYKIPSHGTNGCLKGLVIGTSPNEKGKPTDILAWLEGDRMVVGYVTTNGKHLQDTRYDSVESVIHGVEKLNEPFCWVLASGDETASGRLEALVRYFFLLKGSTQAVKNNLKNFSQNFAGACQDIATAQDTAEMHQRSKAKTVSSGLKSQPKAPKSPSFATPLYDFEVFVDSQEPSSNVAHETSSSLSLTKRQHGHDTSSHESCVTEARRLRLRIQDLSVELMNSDTRAKKAEHEVALWKENYERLREHGRRRMTEGVKDRTAVAWNLV